MADKKSKSPKTSRPIKKKKDSTPSLTESDDVDPKDKKTDEIPLSRQQITIGKIPRSKVSDHPPKTKKTVKTVKTKKEDTTVKNKDKVVVKEEKTKSHYCYILRNHHAPDINRTYNGYTVIPKRRIRQHNQEIKGGADYTKAWGNKSWEMYCLIKGFPDHHNATQCEWKIKHPARKRIRPTKYNSPAGRVIGLNEILKSDRWTGNSTIDNKDLTLKIWILEEYAHLLTDVPDNIEVIPVPVIDLSDV